MLRNTLRRLLFALAARLEGESAPQRLSSTDHHRRWKMSLYEWLAYHQKEIVFDDCSWMGVRTLKNPLDAWIYQEILYEVRPDLLIEIGSHSGGSTLFFAHLMDLMDHGRVLSIDIDRTHYDISHPRVDELTGDCSSPDLMVEVRKKAEGKRVMVIHDGDHSRQAVARDLALYAPLVSAGSYLIVEDGILDFFPPGDDFGYLAEGPTPAVDEFLAGNPDFEVDDAKERYLLTYNPRGFLKRKR